VFGDSRIVIQQACSMIQCKQPELQIRLQQLRALEASFDTVTYHHIRREWNSAADALATQTQQDIADKVYITDETSQMQLSLLNKLPELLYQNVNEVELIPTNILLECFNVLSVMVTTIASDDSQFFSLQHEDLLDVRSERLRRIALAQDADVNTYNVKQYLKDHQHGLNSGERRRIRKTIDRYEIDLDNVLYRVDWQVRGKSDGKYGW